MILDFIIDLEPYACACLHEGQQPRASPIAPPNSDRLIMEHSSMHLCAFVATPVKIHT
jgi:hypothetical protein